MSDELVDEVKRLLALGVDATISDEFSVSPLHQAVKKGNLEIAALLVRYKVNLNAKDTMDGTPLHCAAKIDHKGLINLLIKNGADVNAADSLGETVLDSILMLTEDPSRFGYRDPVDESNKEIVDLLRSYGATSEILRSFYGNSYK